MTDASCGAIHPLWGRVKEANALVRKYHYSHRVPSNIQCVISWHTDGGVLGDTGPAIAACYFTIPPTRWNEDVWELSRLVRHESICPPLTGLIASACKLIRQSGKMDLLVSFADQTQGHHGGIYQAACWNYHGKRDKAMDGVIINGQFIPGRTCNSLYGTRSPDRLAMRGIAATPHYDEGKHLYWRALTKSGEQKARRLGLGCGQYPKPAIHLPRPSPEENQ